MIDIKENLLYTETKRILNNVRNPKISQALYSTKYNKAFRTAEELLKDSFIVMLYINGELQILMFRFDKFRFSKVNTLKIKKNNVLENIIKINFPEHHKKLQPIQQDGVEYFLGVSFIGVHYMNINLEKYNIIELHNPIADNDYIKLTTSEFPIFLINDRSITNEILLNFKQRNRGLISSHSYFDASKLKIFFPEIAVYEQKQLSKRSELFAITDAVFKDTIENYESILMSKYSTESEGIIKVKPNQTNTQTQSLDDLLKLSDDYKNLSELVGDDLALKIIKEGQTQK